MRLLGSKYAKNAFAAGAPPRTRWGTHRAPPETPSWICGEAATGNRRAGKGMEGKKDDGREERAGEGKGP